MKIALDNIIFSLQHSGGISVYWFELVKRLLEESHDLSLYQDELAKNNLFARELIKTKANKAIAVQKESSWPLRLLRYFPFQHKLSKEVIFHSSYYRYAPGAFNVLTVYDFIYEYYRSGLARKVHVWQKSRAINHADAIVCISEHSKNDLLNFYPHIKVPIKVIHMGKSENFFVLDNEHKYSDEVKFLIGQKFYLFIGERRNYKNFQLLLEQLKPEQFLLIVGGGGLQSEEKSKLEKKWGVNYHHFLRPDNNTLNELYNLAFCLLYPSDYEGFGIPVIEAMAAGCPVVCQAVSSLTEVAGDASVFFDKNVEGNHHGSLQNALEKLTVSTFYQNMVARGQENARLFTWDKCYQQTLAFYEASRLLNCSTPRN